jgi:hypothetical protein
MGCSVGFRGFPHSLLARVNTASPSGHDRYFQNHQNVRCWLRHYATSRKVADTLPDNVAEISIDEQFRTACTDLTLQTVDSSSHVPEPVPLNRLVVLRTLRTR